MLRLRCRFRAIGGWPNVALFSRRHPLLGILARIDFGFRITLLIHACKFGTRCANAGARFTG